MSEEVRIEVPAEIGEFPAGNMWMTPESRHRLSNGGNSKGSVPVHGQKSATATIPLYTAETLQAERVRCFNIGAAKGTSEVCCDNCRFFEGSLGIDIDDRMVGRCKRYPPSHILMDGDEYQWHHIEVTVYEWCGEFSPRL